MWPWGPWCPCGLEQTREGLRLPEETGQGQTGLLGPLTGSVTREVLDTGASVLSVPATPSHWSLVPLFLSTGPRRLPGPQSPAQLWPESWEESGHSVPCPCAHTRAPVHTRVPLLVSEVRQPQPPPLVGSALGGLPAFSGRPWWAGVSGSHCLLRLAASLPQARPHSCDRSRQWFPLFRCHRRPEGEPEVG